MAVYLELSGDRSTYEMAEESTKVAVAAELSSAMCDRRAARFTLLDGSELVVNGSALSHARVLDGKVPSRTMNRH